MQTRSKNHLRRACGLLLVVIAVAGAPALAAPTVITSVAAQGDPVPGVLGAVFKTFGPPAIDAGNVAFRATMAVGGGGVTSSGDTGIWLARDGGSIEILAREGNPTPEGDSTFAALGDPVIAGARFAFIGKMKTGNGVKASNASGIWTDIAGSTRRVARQGPLPGGNGRVKFGKFLSVAMMPSGDVVFLATLKGVRGVKTGAFAVDSAGNLSAIILPTLSVTVRGTPKLIKKLEFLPAVPTVGGQTRSFSQASDLVFRVTYADKTSGLVAFRREVLFEEEFDGVLKPAWTVVRQDPSFFTISSNEIDLRLSGGDLYQATNTAKNVFLIDNPAAGDFIVTMKVTSFAPPETQAFPQLDLLAYDSDDDHIRAGYLAFGDGRGFELGVETAGTFDSDVVGQDLGTGTYWLRLLKIGNQYVLLSSLDGVAYETAAGPRTYGDGTPAKLGFVAMADATEAIHARIDSFTVESSLRSVVAGGDPSDAISAGTFRTFGPPLIASSGKVAFAATLAPGAGVSKANDAGIWIGDETSTRLVAREGSAAPGAPGTFAVFSAPVLRGDDAVAFVGTLAKDGAVTSKNAIGVWIHEGIAPRLVARQGADAPGAAAGTTFKTFVSMALPENSGMAFLAQLAGPGVTKANDTGVWAEPLGGPLTLLLRTSDSITVGAATKTVASIEFMPLVKGVAGQSRGFDATPVFVLRATFTDGSEAILRITGP